MKKVTILLIILLTTLSVNAISLGLTKEEAFFQQGVPITFSFTIKNTAGQESKVAIEQNFGQLTEYSSGLPKEVTLQINERAKFEFTVSPPSNLPYGIYPLIITAKETKGTARSAASAQFTIINPPPYGMPYLNFRVDEVKNETAPLALTIRNIGLATLQANPIFSVHDGNKEITTVAETVNIPPLEKQNVYAKLHNVSRGEHIFFVKVNEIEANYTKNSGKPALELPSNITIPQKVTTEITLPVTLNWNKPITSNITWMVYRQGRGFLVSEEQEFTLIPGENQITYVAAIRSAQNGKYRSKLSSANPIMSQEFEVTIDSRLKPKVVLPDKPVEQDEPEESLQPQNKMINNKNYNKVIVLLFAAAGLLFLAAMIRRAKRNESA